jgi:hypothetical protein
MLMCGTVDPNRRTDANEWYGFHTARKLQIILFIELNKNKDISLVRDIIISFHSEKQTVIIIVVVSFKLCHLGLFRFRI